MYNIPKRNAPLNVKQTKVIRNVVCDSTNQESVFSKALQNVKTPKTRFTVAEITRKIKVIAWTCVAPPSSTKPAIFQ